LPAKACSLATPDARASSLASQLLQEPWCVCPFHDEWLGSSRLIGLECQPLKMMAAFGMRIQLNGESLELPDGETVAALLTRLELTGRRVAVELNLDIVPRSQHADTTLNDGDSVEVVHAIGGG
jgi:sulfur carrier protein